MYGNIYIVYETTNLINGKYYIGVHKINGTYYLGSGILLNKAIKKYGRKNFMLETLKEFDNIEDAFEFEKYIVSIDLVKNKNCYNISNGGNAGPCLYGDDNPRTGTKHTIETRLKMSESAIGRKHTYSTKKKLSMLNSGKNHPQYGLKGVLSYNYGRKDSDKTKKLKSESHKGNKAYNSKRWYLFGKCFNSLSEAASCFGVNYQTISNWCKLYNIPHCYVI